MPHFAPCEISVNFRRELLLMTVFPTFIPGCEPRRRWQDDGDKVLCQDVLEQLLEEKVGELEDVQPQREFRYTSGGKPIRLYIYTRDKKRMYDGYGSSE